MGGIGFAATRLNSGLCAISREGEMLGKDSLSVSEPFPLLHNVIVAKRHFEYKIRLLPATKGWVPHDQIPPANFEIFLRRSFYLRFLVSVLVSVGFGIPCSAVQKCAADECIRTPANIGRFRHPASCRVPVLVAQI